MNRRDVLKAAMVVPAIVAAGAFAREAQSLWRYSKEPSAEARGAFEAMFGKLVGPFSPTRRVVVHSDGFSGRSWIVAAGGEAVVLMHTDGAGRIIDRIAFERV